MIMLNMVWYGDFLLSHTYEPNYSHSLKSNHYERSEKVLTYFF